ncbi:hypothetical protein MUU72_14690 [Streptomyces sp. RS10V-4]|uniref:Rv1733c family protein n=1 Tax=Streptomyces rhizoryzae TaxID=2932493 RepID=UPI002004110E|nr:hypothetical protein [Streptomyces rhizoryzae]MCK7624334.1 hypothetical protein [Streptomyces rhizoryzae]
MVPWKPRAAPRRGLPRRGTDVAQTWMALVTGVLIAVAAPATGAAVGSALDTASQQQRADWQQVSAVVTAQPSVPAAGAGDGTGGRVPATVRWTAPDRTVRTGETAVAPGVRPGDRTAVWLDRHGALVRDPSTASDALAQGVAAGTVAAAGTGLLFFGAHKAGVRLLDRRRYAQWEREWAEWDARSRRPQK